MRAEGVRPTATLPSDQFRTLSTSNDTYQSPGQLEAVRAALTTPPGATLAVILPTGEGKSLVFHILARCLPVDPTTRPGVTLVITPTIALALDQERAAAAVRTSGGAPA